MSDAIITQNQARQLGLLMFACVARLGGNGALVDADDHLTVCRLARVDENLCVVDTPPDPAKGRYRAVCLYMIESSEGRFKLDPRHRLATFCATHFALPPDFHLQVHKPPDLWLGPAMRLMVNELQAALDRGAAKPA